MPTPVGHALAGVAAGYLLAGRGTRTTLSVRGTASMWRSLASDKRLPLFASLGVLADIDFLFRCPFGLHPLRRRNHSCRGCRRSAGPQSQPAIRASRSAGVRDAHPSRLAGLRYGRASRRHGFVAAHDRLLPFGLVLVPLGVSPIPRAQLLVAQRREPRLGDRVPRSSRLRSPLPEASLSADLAQRAVAYNQECHHELAARGISAACQHALSDTNALRRHAFGTSRWQTACS